MSTYMWSAMDSPLGILKRRQPSRGVVFRRSIVWRKCKDEVGCLGPAAGKVERTVSGVNSEHEKEKRLGRKRYLVQQTTAHSEQEQ